MNAYYKGQPVFGPRGPAGPDGNPVGTVISFLGTSAPPDYLICDGAARSISDYPELAAFFETQFGAKNHFGGDGETTFAVPDMRNLFLRGYHGEAEEQLSGEIGARQEATRQLWTEKDTSGNFTIGGPPEYFHKTRECDTLINQGGYTAYSRINKTNAGDRAALYTARPVNMAVLYCVKAT